jgi:hypothetical protein
MVLPNVTLYLAKITHLTPEERRTFDQHLQHLPKVLERSLELVQQRETLRAEDDPGDVVIDCSFCCGPDADAWFMSNFGPIWQSAKFFTCSWPGLSCDCGNGGS